MYSLKLQDYNVMIQPDVKLTSEQCQCFRLSCFRQRDTIGLSDPADHRDSDFLVQNIPVETHILGLRKIFRVLTDL